MKLDLLKDEPCPVCRAPLIGEGLAHEGHAHVNGQRWEWQRWSCGAGREWSPNFNRAEVTQVCPKSPGVAKLMAKRAVLYTAMMKLLEEANVDHRYEQRMQSVLVTPADVWFDKDDLEGA